MDRRQLGQDHESLAERYLQQRGLVIRTRNYRCKVGEIDLIAEDRGTLVFVEVRYRGHGSLVTSEESVTPTKQRRIARAAQHYLLYSRADCPCRFDVVAIHRNRLGRPRVHWIDNAFYAPA